MKVGIVSNNDLCLPLLYFLNGNKVDVQLYFGHSLVNDQSKATVDAFCKNSGINFQNGEKSKDSIYSWINSFSPDAVFVMGHIHKIKRNLINSPSSIYNVHFGKLPEYRGSSPVFWQLKNMETEIGCSIHALTDEMDAGPVYWQKEIRNENHFTHNYVQYIFSNLVVDGVKEILLNSNSSQPKEQDQLKVRWYKRPSLKDVLVNWDTMKANEICALTNACNSWNIGAITLFNGMEVKIIDADNSRSDMPSNLAPGTVKEKLDSLCVSCIDDDELTIHYMTLNGIPVAGRHAKKFGITAGQKFTYPSD